MFLKSLFQFIFINFIKNMHEDTFPNQRLYLLCMYSLLVDFTKTQSVKFSTAMNVKFTTKHELYLSGQHFLEYLSMSKMKCTSKCGIEGKCLSANYISWDLNLASSKCQLFDFSEKTSDRNLEVQQNSTYMEKIIGRFTSCDVAINTNPVAVGFYSIVLPSGEAILALCEMANTGGWLVFQRRFDGEENFDLNKEDYERGFGSVRGEFWLGLKVIYDIVSSKPHTLRVDLWFGKEHRYAEYGTFQLTNGTDDYMLAVADYAGNAGDSLAAHNGMRFSTRDHDVDSAVNRHCAEDNKGGWWYKSCHPVSLNANFDKNLPTCNWRGIVWMDWKSKCSLTACELKIRPSL